MPNNEEITVYIQVPRTECNVLFEFLNANGVGAVKSFGIQNSLVGSIDPEKLAQIAKDGTPYLMVYGAIKLVAAALDAFAKTHKKKLKIVKNSKGGIEISAENITPKELQEVHVFDLLKFDSSDDNKPENP